MAALRQKYNHAEFFVFTSPISAELFELLANSGRGEQYLIWIEALVGVFGKVYDTMGINSFTDNSQGYRDLHHFYPQRTQELTQEFYTGEPKFGRHVTQENLSEHLSRQRQLIAGILADESSAKCK